MTPPTGDLVASSHVRQVVGIGSSAGGLEALQEFLAGVQPGSGSAFVIAQHLAPEHPSLIVELLTRTTRLAVTTAADGDLLLPDVIAVGPPNADITVDGDRLRVVAPRERFGPSPSIDLLFASIAEHWGPRSVAVILSGTGSDGSHGMRLVRAAGGLTMVQTPEEARFDGMPRSALALGGVDVTAGSRDLGRRLSQLPTADGIDGQVPEPPVAALLSIVQQLKSATGMDFSQYKESTVRRQVQRRMAIRQVAGVEDYLPILTAEPAEAQDLVAHLLVAVTSFFRDPEAFTALRSELTAVLADWSPDQVFRVWVPGCATGEEVYTLAMVLSEVLGDPATLSSRIKIFGTDLDEPSLAIARKASYAIAAADRIPADLRSRYTVDVGDHVRIVERLRDCVVFARHDVGQDPPFPRIDLLSCRNTLIYFTNPLQDRVISMFEYALKPGGLLLLGAAESLGHRNPAFEAMNATHRIFGRTEHRSVPPALSTSSAADRVSAGRLPSGRVAVLRDTVSEQHTALLESLVRAIAQPLVVLDENHDLVEVVGDVSPFCHLPQGQVTSAIASFLAPELQAEARALFLMCRAEQEPVVGRAIELPDAGLVVRLRAMPLLVSGRILTALTFLVQDADSDIAATVSDRDQSFDRELERLERELMSSQDTLRESLEELESANEELEASAEELQASSEELQATNEELEASNEELQATNEELGTLNVELRHRGDEFQLLNTDLVNIESSLNQGMVIVDQEGNVVRYSPLAVRVFGLAEQDIGTSLLAVPTTLEIPGLADAVVAATAGERHRSIEASGANGVSFLVQVLPYQDRDGRRRGAIITLTDVSETMRLRRLAENAALEFARLTDSLTEAVWKREAHSGRVLYASDRMRSLTGWTPEELVDQDGLLDEAIHPDDRVAVNAARGAGASTWSVQYRMNLPHDRTIWVQEVASDVVGPEGTFVVGTLADVTAQRELTEAAANASDIFQTVFDTSAFGVVILDDKYRILDANAAFRGLVDFDAASIIGAPAGSFIAPGKRGQSAVAAARDGAGPATTRLNSEIVRRDGTSRWVTGELRVLPRRIGNAYAIAVVQDVTDLRQKTQLLTSQAAIDAATGLLNRRTFTEALDKEIERCRRSNGSLALAWIDLDGFKEINDEHGHEAGDTVLRVTAERIEAVVRSNDIVGRIGGDEYGVVISDYERPEELEIALDRVLEALRQPIRIGDLTTSTSGSVGIALYPADSTTGDDLIRDADAAMYAVKRQGGDNYGYFAESINIAADERRRMRTAVTHAIAEDQFELHYQPIVASDTGELWGVEALLRWHRDGEVVTAQDFIPFAEESHQIRALGMVTFSHLRSDLVRLREAGFERFPVTVNMSVRQLEDERLAELLGTWPSARGLDGIVVEVVESIFLPDNHEAMANLVLLASQGALVAVDDYGTGYSNMTLLAELSPALIKIDRSLLDRTIDETRRPKLFHACVDLAHSLGSRVIAEGVENAEQRAFATELGADLLQGYLIARPMPADLLISWIESYHPEA